MQINFHVGKKLKWFLIGLATVIISATMLSLFGGDSENATIIGIISCLTLVCGGFMSGGMILAMIIEDMENDY